jgi:hypothetical protein
MTTLQSEWRTYRDKAYPKGVNAIQNQECHQAFFAGAAVALGNMSTLAELPEDEAVVELQKLFTEAMSVLQLRSQHLNQPRN